MNTKHTAGEWHTKEGQIYPLTTGRTLALIPYFDSNNTEHEANAKLIAAAPELLEALKELLTWANIKDGSGSQYLRDKCQQAINKATL